jgi:hypothetical protein
MQVSLVIDHMKKDGQLDWNDDTSIIIGDNSDWSTLKVRNGSKPSSGQAAIAWAEIEPTLTAEATNIALFDALRSGSNSSSKALAVFAPVVEVLETYTVAGHLLTVSEGKTIAELCATALIPIMENLPLDSGPTGSNWNQTWNNYKAMVMSVALESALPSLTTEDEYRQYNDFVDDFIVNWGIKVLLSR